MKRIIISITFIFAFSCCHAQNDSNKHISDGFISVGSGISVPMGAFGGKFDMPGNVGEFQNAVGEYAKTGYSINISFGEPINHSHFGVTGMFNYVQHGFNMNDYIPNQIGVVGSITPVSYTRYHETNILLGLFSSFRVNKNISYDFGLLFGLLFLKTPEVIDSGRNVYSRSLVQEGTWDLKSTNFISFASDLSAGIRCQCGRFTCFSLRTDLYFAERTANSELGDALSVPLEFTESKTGYVTDEQGKLYLDILLLNITAGIGIILGR